MPNGRRTLLDIASGGQYKTSRDLPDFKELIDLAAARQAVWMSEEVYPGSGVTQGNLYDIVMGAASVKTASTGIKLFSGWRDNLLEYMAGASKKERRLVDTIIRKASDLVNVDDIQGTRNVLSMINREWGLSGKVSIPTIKGAAGGAMRQARKKRGAQARKQTKGEKWRKQAERKEEIAAKKRKQTGDEPYHRGTLKID